MILVPAVRMLIASVALALFFAAPAHAQSAALPPEVEAVRKHILEQDYPERFGDKSYRTAVENIVLTDLDGDGAREAVVLFRPHFRQSASIVIYRLTQDLQVKRVTEGLAPGPLVPLTGAFLDSHGIGQGVDFTVDGKRAPVNRDVLIQGFIKSRFGAVTEYKSFFHADGRRGDLSYVDMRHVDLPHAKQNCEDFQFSLVDEIAAGALEGGPPGTRLAARVGTELWLYSIGEFLPNGLLRKEMEVRGLPTDFARFAPSVGSLLSYQTSSGEIRPLR